MKLRAGHILPALALACVLVSCTGRTRIIPRGILADIYADMFLADQWLADHPDERKSVDTMLFYDPIIKRYGYTFEDYDASVKRYMKDPEKFSKIFRNASKKLGDERARFGKLADRQQAVIDFNAAIKGYKVKDFDKDTVIWRTRYKDARDSLRRDSLLRDSLLRDSLRLDSLRLDSLRLDSLRRDSLKHVEKIAKHRKSIDKPVKHKEL